MSDLQKKYPALARRVRRRIRAVARQYDPTNVVLGAMPDNEPLCIPLRNRMQQLFWIGATGSGKSSALLHYFIQLVRLGEGGLLLDPHGTLANHVLAALRQLDRHVHVIDISSGAIVGFNPLQLFDGIAPSVVVGMIMDVLSTVIWEGEPFSQKPSIERVLWAILVVCVELGLTLPDAKDMLEHDDKGLRAYAIAHVKDYNARRELIRLEDLARDRRRKRDFDNEVVGPLNRLTRLLRTPIINAILSQPKCTLDFQKAMDEGHVIIANLAGLGQSYEKDAALFGGVLIRTVLFNATRRKKTTPFNLVIDEASRFLSNDIPQLLAEVRKYNVSVTSVIQWLAQADANENIKHALLNTGVKVAFRLRESDDAERLARDMVPVNLERPVQALIRPTVVGHRVRRMANESEQENSSQIETDTYVRTTGRADMDGVTHTLTFGDIASQTETEGDTVHSTKGGGTTTGAGANTSEIAIPTSDPNKPHITRVVNGESTHAAETANWVEGKAHNTGKAKTTGTQTTEGIATTKATTITESEAVGKNKGKQTGRGSSRGTSEALEPILEDRPSAVHSLPNELYRSGVMLKNLPTATGFCSFVGPDGPVATLFTVPPIMTPELSADDLRGLRAHYAERSGSAIALEDAQEVMRAREERVFIASDAPKAKPRPRTHRKRFDEPEQGSEW